MLFKKSKVVLSILLLIGFSFCLTADFLDSFNDVLDTFNDTHRAYKDTRNSIEDANNTVKNDTNTIKDMTTQSPPSLPTQVEFYVAINNEQHGPFDLDSLKYKIIDREIDKNTLVWREGMERWAKAGEMPLLNPLFTALPPPLPPPLP